MTIALELTPEAEARLEERARRAGLSPSDYVQRLLEQASDGDEGPPPPLQHVTHRTSDEIIREALGAVPASELRKLPSISPISTIIMFTGLHARPVEASICGHFLLARYGQSF